MSWDRRPARRWRHDQSRALAEWLRREVGPFSAFWGSRLGDTAISDVDALEALPVVTDSDVSHAGGPGNPALLVVPTQEQFQRHASLLEVLAAAREASGGTADARRAVLFRRYKPVHVHEAGLARPLTVAYTRADLDRFHLAGARLAEVLGLGADDRMVNLVPSGPTLAFWGLYHTALATLLTALHPRGFGELPLEPALAAVAVLPPTVIAVPVAEADVLLEELRPVAARLDGLRTLLTVGPPPPADRRAELAAALARLGVPDAKVQAVWAPDSARALWGECRPPAGDPPEATYGLHTDPDMAVVQVRDPVSGAPAAGGGEIVHTSVGWRGTALVRFASGGYTGGLVTAPCPACARTLPRLAPDVLEAAWQPRVLVTDGRRPRVDLRAAPEALSTAALAGTGVRDWSLYVDDDGHFVLAVDGGAEPALEGLASRVGAAVGVVPAVEVDPRAAARRPRIGPFPPGER